MLTLGSLDFRYFHKLSPLLEFSGHSLADGFSLSFLPWLIPPMFFKNSRISFAAAAYLLNNLVDRVSFIIELENEVLVLRGCFNSPFLSD